MVPGVVDPVVVSLKVYYWMRSILYKIVTNLHDNFVKINNFPYAALVVAAFLVVVVAAKVVATSPP